MARKKPISGKSRKEYLKLKRASKRDQQDGDGLQDGATTSSFNAQRLGHAASNKPSTKSKTGPKRYMTLEDKQRAERVAGRVKLESRFIRLPTSIQERHRTRAATHKLERPVDISMGVLTEQQLQPSIADKLGNHGDDDDERKPLTCPKRPKWRYSMTKLEVERNEEGMFEQWLKQTDIQLTRFARETKSRYTSEREDEDGADESPTYFERNLNVWRQLWRTTEVSEILLILVDVRFPLLHYPPSLSNYVKTLRDKRVILVLTKTDLVPTWIADSWRRYFEHQEGPDGAEVVMMESYREIERRDETQGTHARYEPGAPAQARIELVDALRRAHEKLLTPPKVVAGYPDRLARWKPRVRREIDWESVEDEMEAKEREARERGAKDKKSRRRKDRDTFVPRRQRADDEETNEESQQEGTNEESQQEGERQDVSNEGDAEGCSGDADDPHPFISIGLLGQPNVGKSSLLNALLGRKVVRASRTPGKTKSLQTIYWNKTIRLVDCPGLVCPSFAGFQRQVLAGIIPIQNIEAVLHFVALRMPLERALGLEEDVVDNDGEDDLDREMRATNAAERDDHNTRSGKGNSKEEEGWTTDEILMQYALQQDFVTAKAGRPDIYRAGAYILRQLHSSQIPWAFQPPDEHMSIGINGRVQTTKGIWLTGFVAKASSTTAMRSGAVTTEDEGTHVEGTEEEEEDDDSDEEEEEDSEAEADEAAATAVQSAFAALEVEQGEGSDSDDEVVAEADIESSSDDA
ncbi:hypothetical protein OIO90_001099 [Microbotryomycetes sp. JL221]|nr:hypothetical protein OIO90_001099 [Microbotryomycetes sp. JL221]